MSRKEQNVCILNSSASDPNDWMFQATEGKEQEC